MKKTLAFTLLFILLPGLKAQETTIFNGFDGGMMLHTGYISGNIGQLNHTASGTPFGIGGVARIHLREHWRIGAEGYVSVLSQLNNGSYIKYGWGGVLGDFNWRFNRFIPYIGLTIGGGKNTNLLIMEKRQGDWEPVGKTYYNENGFFALAPFIGCEFVVSEAFHLTLKTDWLNCFNKTCKMPSGPRLYFGFIFSH